MNLKAPNLNIINPKLEVVPKEGQKSGNSFNGQLDTIKEGEKVGRCIEKLPFNCLISDDYESWTSVALSLSELGESGRDLFHEFSKKSDKYDPQICDRKFDNALKTRDGRISLASFYTLCAKEGALYKSDNNQKPGIYENSTVSGSIKVEKSTFTDLLTYKYNASNLIPKPIGVITIGDCIISTAGNLTVIAGPSKVGKSGLVGAVLAGAIRVQGSVIEEENLMGVTVALNKDNKGIIHADSEQSRYDHQRSNQQVSMRANRHETPEHYYSFSLQKFTPKELIEATKVIFKEVAIKHNGLHLAIIDGIGDYVSSVNDEIESNEVVSTFIKLATEYNIPIVLVLHFNPGSEKGRGHIGSHLERKCESFLSVEKVKDSGISVIKPKLLRNSGGFDELQFEYNEEKGFHTLLARVNKEAISQERREKNRDAKLNHYHKILSAVYAEKDQLRFTELQEAIMEPFGIKKDGAKKKIAEFVTLEIIQHNGLFYLFNKGST